jgi:hypothetical protein
MQNEINELWQKISEVWSNPTVSIWKKIKTLSIEMAVIIGSILLAQYIERLREQRHEAREAKEFLLGLKQDISEDIVEVNEVLESYGEYKVLYNFLSNYDPVKVPNKDSLNDIIMMTRSSAYLRPNTSRFEGFKSSGKLDQIENKELLNAILEFYQDALPKLSSSTTGWINYHAKLNDYLVDNLEEYPNGRSNFEQIIKAPRCKNLCKRLVPWGQLFERHKHTKDLGNQIIIKIAREYNLE